MNTQLYPVLKSRFMNIRLQAEVIRKTKHMLYTPLFVAVQMQMIWLHLTMRQWYLTIPPHSSKRSLKTVSRIPCCHAQYLLMHRSRCFCSVPKI